MRLHHRVVSFAAAVGSFAACSGASQPSAPPPATPAPTPIADPGDPPLPALRTGAVELIDGAPIDARVVAHFVAKDLETVELDLAVGECDGPGMYRTELAVEIDLGPGRARAWGTHAPAPSSGHLDVLFARPRELAGQPIAGDVLVTPGCHQAAGERVAFKTDAPTAAPSPPQLPITWANDLADELGDLGGWRVTDAWHAFARDRLAKLAGTGTANAPRVTPPSPDDLARLMETTTGIDALQEALQADRGLLAANRTDKPTVDLATLQGPALSPHPWAEMMKALGRTAPGEALAAEAPAEFYYVRFASVSALFRILDAADTWATPVLSVLDGRAEQRALAERYQTQLGLERSQLARAFGDRVVAELAVVGSDPYFGEGTDLTLVFRVKAKAVFDSTLAAALASHGAAHGGITTTTVDYQGTAIVVARSADGAVHRYRAQLGELELVSNSLAAAERVVDTHAGRHPSLAAEPDFQYALARGADVPADVLAFIGDRFVGAVIGAAQKIQEARRQIALAELSTPAYAGLLYGLIYGRSPSSADELIAAGLLDKAELVHHDGTAIAWRPGTAPSSPWGTPSAMTPLIDLPAVTTVTTNERDAYARFASTYETYWKRYIDPIAIRVAIGGDALTIDTRVLPLIDDSEYKDVAMIVGDSHVVASPLASGARVVLGIGDSAIADASRELGYFARELANLSWLGNWVAIGVEDRTQVAVALLAEAKVPQKPEPEPHERDRRARDSALMHLPAYAEIGIRDRAAAALFIIGLRKFAQDAVPGVLTWGESSRVGDVSIVKVAAKDDTFKGMAVYYAFVKDALAVSLDEHTLARQVALLVAGHGAGGAPPTAASAAQLVLDVAGAQGGPLQQTVAWALDELARKAADRSALVAQALFGGAPELAGNADQMRTLAMQIFGAQPLTADGRAYELGPAGLRDPLRGNRFAPAWPSLPVAGSPIGKLLAALARARAEISFDNEPASGGATTKSPLRSLHLHVTLGMR